MNIIELDNPKQVNSKKVEGLIKQFATKGIRSVEIRLQLNFVCPDNVTKSIVNDFQKAKNKVYFQIANN